MQFPQFTQLTHYVIRIQRRCVEAHDLVRRTRQLTLPRSRALVRTARERLHRGELLRAPQPR